jgi:hypothetical protein
VTSLLPQTSSKDANHSSGLQPLTTRPLGHRRPYFSAINPPVAAHRHKRMALRRSLHARPAIVGGEDSTPPAVPVACGRGLSGRWCRRSCHRLLAGSCQRFARNCATRNLTPLHDPALGTASHLRCCKGTKGPARRCELPAHRWHARGQGFKSPQLHQAQRIDSIPAQGRLSAECQQITICDGHNTLSVGRFGRLPVFSGRGSSGGLPHRSSVMLSGCPPGLRTGLVPAAHYRPCPGIGLGQTMP